MKSLDTHTVETREPRDDIGSTILGILLNIGVTSLLTGLAVVIAFVVMGFASPSGLVRVGMAGMGIGFPGGLLISFAIPLCNNKHRLAVLLVGASVWATAIGVIIVSTLSRSSFA